MTSSAVHGALLLTQFCWGSAAVVNKIGLSGAGISPLLFALIREVSAAPLLLLLLCFSKRHNQRGATAQGLDLTEDGQAMDVKKVKPRWILRLLPGLFIFLDQMCSLTGVRLAGPVAAAAWQPSQVVFTVIIGVCLRMEKCTGWKGASVILTVAGTLCLSFLHAGNQEETTTEDRDYYIGQVCFLVNCLSSSLEVILWRLLLCNASSDVAHLAVMAESYLVSACFMAIACVLSSLSPGLVDFLCPKCDGNPWHVPFEALWAIAYSVIFQTMVAYVAQAWALRYAPASLASFYATAQPIMAAFVTCSLLIIGCNPGGVLEWPGAEMSGAFLIIAGLVVAEHGNRQLRADEHGFAEGAGDAGQSKVIHDSDGSNQVIA